jgi:hypothetical protein
MCQEFRQNRSFGRDLLACYCSLFTAFLPGEAAGNQALR